MAWTVTADVRKFDEAVDYFRKRTPVTDKAYNRLRKRARDRAFWISGVNEMRTVQTVYDEIDRAVADGTPFDDFKRRVRASIGTHEVGGAHLETVFRNAVQTAYNSGRWDQLSDPAVTNTRPYRLLDVTLDSRTSKVCRPLEGLCRPHDDPIWLTFWPPLHHRCRTGVRSIRRSEALKLGITTTVKAQPQKGFGYAPPLRADSDPNATPPRPPKGGGKAEPRPGDEVDLSNVPKEIADLYRKRRGRNRQK